MGRKCNAAAMGAAAAMKPHRAARDRPRLRRREIFGVVAHRVFFSTDYRFVPPPLACWIGAPRRRVKATRCQVRPTGGKSGPRPGGGWQGLAGAASLKTPCEYAT